MPLLLRELACELSAIILDQVYFVSTWLDDTVYTRYNRHWYNGQLDITKEVHIRGDDMSHVVHASKLLPEM